MSVAFFHDAVNGAFAEFDRQDENLRRQLAQAAVVRFQTVELLALRDQGFSVRQRRNCSA